MEAAARGTAPRSAERRLVHVLFADLVGFTPLVEDLDAEDVALLQEEYFARARAAVAAAGGQVEKFVGDAVMATFGLPTLRPDDAVRAVRAGQAIVTALEGVESALGLPPGTLQVRVGVHTGEVVVSWGPEPGAWRLSGDVVTTASRLQTAAEPGTVVVGPETAVAVAEVVELQDLGAVTLKGKADPVPAWRVGPAGGTPAPARRPPRPMLGRADEIDRLESAYRAVADGAGRVAMTVVLAPPGVGRTRLVDEFADRMAAVGVPVWRTAVPAVTEGSGYLAVADLLRRALGWTDGIPDDAATALRERLAAHGHPGPSAEQGADHALALLSGATPGAAPSELFTSWTAVLDAVDGPAPIWVIDDLHRAGPDLRAFVDHALDAPHRPARSVLATARPGANALVSRADTVLVLDPLPEPVMVRLVENEAGADALTPETVAEIARVAGGTPLFVTELLRAWRHAGLLSATGSGGPRPEVPSTVRAIYLGQLDALAPGSREVLETGSVAGITVPGHALPGLGVTEPAAALDDLTGSGLLTGPHDDAVDPISYTYRHVLLRDAAYATLPRARRAALHLRLARWLAGTPGPAERVGLQLAAAWEQAPALGGTIDGLTRAELAEDAAERLAEAGESCLGAEPQRAAALFLRARDIAGAQPSAARAHRQLRAGEALRRAGRLTEAMDAFAAVPEAGGDGSDPRTLVDAALGYEDALFDSRLPRSQWNPQALALVDGALATAPPTADRARLYAARARALAYADGAEEAGDAATTALDLAERSGDPGALAYALLARRATLSDPARLDQRLAVDDALRRAARAAGDPTREFEALRLCFVDRLEQGDVATAERMRAQAEDLGPHLGRPVYLWYPPMWRVMTALLHGRVDEAAARVEEFREEGERWHYRDTDQVHAVQLLALETERGSPERALPALERVAATAGPRFAVNVGVALARAGRLAEARAQLDTVSADGFAVIPADGARSFLLAHAAEIADAVGDADAGAAAYAQLAPWTDRAVVVGAGALCLGAAAHHRGLAARACGDLDAARTHLRVAAAMNEAMRAPLLAARSAAELARTTT